MKPSHQVDNRTGERKVVNGLGADAKPVYWHPDMVMGVYGKDNKPIFAKEVVVPILAKAAIRTTLASRQTEQSELL